MTGVPVLWRTSSGISPFVVQAMKDPAIARPPARTKRATATVRALSK